VRTSTPPRPPTGIPLEAARARLAERLRDRWQEIERAAMTRLYGISEPAGTPDPEYTDGLRAAASAALRYLLAGVEQKGGEAPSVPAAVLVQARMAARHRVSLDTVMRRCFAGFALFGDFLMQEVEDARLLESTALKRLLRAQAALFDRLLAAVTEEYTRIAEEMASSRDARRAERIERLLGGEIIDASDLAYDLDAHHLGVVVKGAGAAKAAREIAVDLDCRLLAANREGGTVWTWLGFREPLDLSQLQRRISAALPAQARAAIGEPGEGLAGWRLTHMQAKAALPIALRGEAPLVCYGDVALLASTLQNDLLVTHLHDEYLAPLEQGRDGGVALRETLRAYFAAERNISSAAVALGVNRRTVASRLRAAEDRLGRHLCDCAVELDLALRLDALGQPL
jgi:GGDEF-like domain/PucR C-terminal helix-turn-helix domain